MSESATWHSRCHCMAFKVSMKDVKDWKSLQGFEFVDEGASASNLAVKKVTKRIQKDLKRI